MNEQKMDRHTLVPILEKKVLQKTKCYYLKNLLISYQYKKIIENIYRKVVSSNTSYLEAHAGFFRLLMKGVFDPYVLPPFDKKLIL